jgi:hypothetical protein
MTVLALTTMSCRPSVRAAAGRSVILDWAEGMAGSARTPNRAELGINSWSNCNRFGPSSVCKMAMPVRFAPGRLRLATRPDVTGSAAATKTIGMVGWKETSFYQFHHQHHLMALDGASTT